MWKIKNHERKTELTFFFRCLERVKVLIWSHCFSCTHQWIPADSTLKLEVYLSFKGIGTPTWTLLFLVSFTLYERSLLRTNNQLISYRSLNNWPIVMILHSGHPALNFLLWEAEKNTHHSHSSSWPLFYLKKVGMLNKEPLRCDFFLKSLLWLSSLTSFFSFIHFSGYILIHFAYRRY